LVSRHWRLLGAFALLGAALGVAVALLITPIYRAETILAPAPEPGQIAGIEALGGQLGGVAGLLGLGSIGQSRTKEYIAALQSRLLTNKFIAENGLIPILFANRYEAAEGSAKLKSGEEEPTIEEAYRRFDQRVRHVSESAQTGLITVAVDWRDPDLAARWANDLVKLANSELRKQQIDIADRSIAFLNSELEKTNVIEIRQAIYKLIEGQIQDIMIANVREEFAFRVVDPAGVRDLDDPQSPNRPLIVLLLFGLASMLGLFTASFVEGRRVESP
jgi:uncharacterized protein involved in exopolysaccharide biosynthesis